MQTILTQQQIRAVDAFTVTHEPIASIDLMERAATACACSIIKLFDTKRKMAVFAGPGNNGGDGLAIARILQQNNYDVSVYLLTTSDRLSPDALINLQRIAACKPELLCAKKLPTLLPSTVIIDALFGIGLSRPLDGLAAQTVAHINKTGCTVVSIDLPSGLFCDDNRRNIPSRIIQADYTLTFQQPKRSFFFSENETFVGKWKVVDIGLLAEAIEQQPSKFYMLEKQDIERYVLPRCKFAHKGEFGNVCIIAGSLGMMGASVLATKACLRMGAGRVTAHVPNRLSHIIQISVPEALVSMDDDEEAFSNYPAPKGYSAIAIGPGIGRRQQTSCAMLAMLTEICKYREPMPLVLDADALNLLSELPNGLTLLPPNSVITPHVGEFERIFGNSSSAYERNLLQIEMAHRYSIFIVLKGAHTSIATPEGRCFFNTTGNPGMATAGSGDVLTGMIISLLAQKYPVLHAVSAGVWLHGAAGDIAVSKQGQQCVMAGDIIENIGKAFNELTIDN
jgi:NAD(P)H-hydrate epimerase